MTRNESAGHGMICAIARAALAAKAYELAQIAFMTKQLRVFAPRCPRAANACELAKIAFHYKAIARFRAAMSTECSRLLQGAYLPHGLMGGHRRLIGLH
jgi:hypothetical protein